MESKNLQDEERVELEVVLSSDLFQKSPNLSRLLFHICAKYWEGKADELREYNIGVDALGRTADFDPSSNSIVRVEVRRLREKLKKYYETAGADHTLRITLQLGHYVPQFVRVGPDNLVASAQEGEISRKVADFAAESSFHAAKSGEVQKPPVPSFARSEPQRSRPGFLAKGNVKQFFYANAFTLFFAICLGLSGGWILWRHFKAAPTRSASRLKTSNLPAAMPAGGMPYRGIRIICGYSKEKYVDRSGKVWAGDRFFNGGGTEANPPVFIARTADPTLYRTDRHGKFSYNIPLSPGNYELRLHFVETMFGPGLLLGGGETSRLFDVSLNGRPLLSQFDIYADAGGANIADIRAFKDISPSADGYLHLKFLRRTSEPLVNAIEIFQVPHGKISTDPHCRTGELFHRPYGTPLGVRPLLPQRTDHPPAQYRYRNS
jgi:hypothetical protein